MARTSKDPAVPPLEWAKHLKPFGKKKFNRRVRRAVRREIKQGKLDS